MYTGLVQGLCTVERVIDRDGLRTLEINLGSLAEGLASGGSVAVNGTCLTATSIAAGRVRFDVVPQTLRVTNLGDVQAGEAVNIERSARIGDELGGHKVAGHVCDTVIVVDIAAAGHDRVMTFEVAPEWLRYLFPKGFVALDGASLTISGLDRAARRLQVSLIPETLARTTFGTRRVGDRVNLEVDSDAVVMVDTVTSLLADPDWLEAAGILPAKLRGASQGPDAPPARSPGATSPCAGRR